MFFCHIFSKIHKIVHKVPFFPKKGKVYFRYFFNFSKKSRLFLYDLPFFSQFYENFGPKKPFLFLSKALWRPPKKGKRGKKGIICTFPKSTSFGSIPPQILAANDKLGESYSKREFLYADPPNDFGFPMIKSKATILF